MAARGISYGRVGDKVIVLLIMRAYLSFTCHLLQAMMKHCKCLKLCKNMKEYARFLKC